MMAEDDGPESDGTMNNPGTPEPGGRGQAGPGRGPAMPVQAEAGLPPSGNKQQGTPQPAKYGPEGNPFGQAEQYYESGYGSTGDWLRDNAKLLLVIVMVVLALVILVILAHGMNQTPTQGVVSASPPPKALEPAPTASFQVLGRLWPFLLLLFGVFVAQAAAYAILWQEQSRQRLEEVSRLNQQLLSAQEKLNQLTAERDRLKGGPRIGQTLGGPQTSPRPNIRADLVKAPPPIPQQPVPAVRVPEPVQVQAPATFTKKPLQEPGDEQEHPDERVIPEKGATREGWVTVGQDWRLVGASRRGLGHEDEGKYREDDVSVKAFGDAALVAIADGVGSKRLSRHGARAAVLGATSLPDAKLRSQLRDLVVFTSRGDAGTKKLARQVIVEACEAAAQNVLRKFQEDHARDASVTLDDLHSTLLIYLTVHVPGKGLLLAGTQVGDGALYARLSGTGKVPQDRWKVLLHQQVQGANNEVTPFLRSKREDWDREFVFELIPNADLIMGMTDGTADDLRPPVMSSGQPADPYVFVDEFGTLILEKIGQTPQRPQEALLDFLGYRKKQSLDDRTVVCLYRNVR